MTGYGELMIPGFCGFGLHLKLDGFRLVYVAIAVLMWAVSGVFSSEYMAHYKNRRRYDLFFWLTFFATVGVFLSADLYTTFIFFEIMSFTSYVWVAFDEKKESLRAAETYLAVAVIGGMVMLMGLFLLYHLLGTLEIDEIRQAAAGVKDQRQLYVAGGLLLFGFGAKAGCFPLHIWLPKAHPVAPAPASALLSGILTKTGIFGVIVVSCRIFGGDWYWGFLIAVLGIITMFWGAFLALFSVNLKKTLACSSVSQIGFILVGIGMYGFLAAAGENPSMAARGAFLHMVNHSLFKLVLFLCAGAVYMNLHQLDLNEIRGYGRKKPVLKFCFLMGAVGIAGVPLWSGYISKTLLHESMVEYQMLLMEEGVIGSVAGGLMTWIRNPALWKAAEWIFLLSGGMTAAYMTKLFVAVFVEKHPERQAEFDAGHEMKKSSAAVLLIPAVLLPVLGMAPTVTMDRLADLGQGFFLAEGLEHAVSYFSMVNLKGSFLSLGIGLLIYVGIIRRFLMKENRYVDRWPSRLDLENLVYRPILQTALPAICGTICSVVDRYLVSAAVSLFVTVSSAVCGFIDRYLAATVVKVFLSISAVICRMQDSLADGLILLARKTTHRQLKEPAYHHERDRAARTLGGLVDHWNRLCYRLKGGRKKGVQEPVSRIPLLVKKEEIFLLLGKMIDESFSFGLLLFAIGLCVTLGYLIVVFLG